MAEPERTRLNIAIIVCLRVEEEKIEFGVSEKAELASITIQIQRDTLHLDRVASLGDISLQIIVVQTFASQTELSECSFWDLRQSID